MMKNTTAKRKKRAQKKRIGDGVGTGKIRNGSSCSRTKKDENTNVNMDKNLPVESSREPIDCPRNSTDEGGILNGSQYAEKCKVSMSDEVGFINCCVLQQVEELSSRLASVEAQMRTGPSLHKLASVNDVKRGTSVSPLRTPLQCPVFLSPPLIPDQQGTSSDLEETESDGIQWSTLVSQIEAVENSSWNSLAHNEEGVAHSMDSNWPLLCSPGCLQNVRNFEEGERRQRWKSLSLLEYLRVEVLGTDTHGCGDPQATETLRNFLSVPSRLERLVLFGFLMCVDTFLFVPAFLPLRAGRGLLAPLISSGRIALTVLRCLLGVRKPTIDGAIQFLVASVKHERSYMYRTYLNSLYDCMRLSIIALVLLMMQFLDMSRIYHYIRGQSMIKLYVLIGMIGIFDRLMCSFGQDVFDSLHWSAIHLRKRKIVLHYTVCLSQVALHTLLLFIHVVTLTVAVNSSDQAVLTLLISNNFSEIKSSVFKKCDKHNLLQITCYDIVERFKLILFLLMITLLNLTHGGGGDHDIYAFLQHIALLIIGGEMLADWIKHAFITKFNQLGASIYEGYSFVFAKDIMKRYEDCGAFRSNGILDHSYFVEQRLAFAALPLNCVFMRVFQIATPRLLGYIPGCPPLALCLICFLSYVMLLLLKILTGLLLLIYSYKTHPETASGGPPCSSSLGVIGGSKPGNEKERAWLTCNLARRIASSSELTNGLLGGLDDEVIRVQVDSWLEIAVKTLYYEPWKEKDLQGLNVHMDRRTYIAGGSTLPSVDLQAVRRWCDAVLHGLRAFAPSCNYLPRLPFQAVFIEPVVFPLPGESTASTHASVTCGRNRSKGAVSGKVEHERGNKTTNREFGEHQDEGSSAIPSRKGDSSRVEVKTTASNTIPDPSNLDIRVGVIVNVWVHPESEKLWCEEIDIGEKAPRKVLNGLRAHYKEEELMGAKVVVLINVKARKMGSLKSEGMIMCASNIDHTVVKIIVPPEGSKPGDRILFQGLPEGAALTPNQVERKKVLVNCLPYFKTNEVGIPGFNGADFHVKGVGTCCPLMPNAAVL